MMKEKRSPSQLEALWKESDMSNGRKVDAMVVILRTNGCCWVRQGGCTMCGYREASLTDVTEDDLLKQLEQALAKYKGEPFVKIYTSGSFLDDNEVPPEVRRRFFEAFSGCERILFESRPEFITPESLADVPKTATIALGLESSDFAVLERSVHKGFTPEDIRRAGTLAKESGLMVRTYLLLKPPFMTEDMAIEDAVRSARFADPFSDEISVNPLNVQRGTYVERLDSCLALCIRGSCRRPPEGERRGAFTTAASATAGPWTPSRGSASRRTRRTWTSTVPAGRSGSRTGSPRGSSAHLRTSTATSKTI